MKRGVHPIAPKGEPAGADERRDGARFPLLLNAQCITVDGQELQVWLTDISHTGCQIFTCAESLKGQRAVVLVGYGDDGRAGEVAWASGMKAGVRFDLALSTLALNQLLTAKPVPPCKAELECDRPVDQFGRKLAPLPQLSRDRKLGP